MSYGDPVIALSRLTSARLAVALLACVVCALSSAAAAYAKADQTISYTDPHGGTSAEREGTSHYQGNDAAQENVTVGLFSGKMEDNGLKCNSEGPESEQCDLYDVFIGSYEAIKPCETDGFDVLCPDAENFAANLGEGANDSYTLDAPLQYQTATVNAGNGGDFIEGTNPAEFGEFPDQDIFTGGTGNDLLVGGPGNDILRGGPGNDTLDGRGDDDELLGEGGNDSIYGGASGSSLEAGGEGVNTLGWEFNLSTPDAGKYDGGNETFDGAGGTSTVSFEGAPGPVTARVDGLPDSGVAGQKDTIETNIAEVNGSENGDTLIAGTTPVTLDGEGGNDTIYGGPGGDTLRGGAGNNTIYAEGPDGAGPDNIFAAEEYCNLEVSCPSGNSVIYANDAFQNQISCGPGADIVYANAVDVVSTSGIFGCPTVYRSAATGNPGSSGNPGSGGGNPGGGPGNPGGALVFSLVSPAHSVHTFISKGLTLSSSCTAACTLAAVATISSAIAKKAHLAVAKALVIGSGHTTLHSAGRATVKVGLTSKAKRALAHLKRFPVTITLTSTSGGKVTSASKTITL
jgi:Ca2+-binding RTX toxin-like protein